MATNSTIKKAQSILNKQKSEYKRIFKAEVRKAKNPQAGARSAGSIYRQKFGSTPSARWKKALREAQK